MKLAEQSSAVIYTLGVFDEEDPDRNPAVLKAWRRPPGGEAFFPTNSAKWSPSAGASRGTFVINTRSDMFQANLNSRRGLSSPSGVRAPGEWPRTDCSRLRNGVPATEAGGEPRLDENGAK